MTNVDLSSLSTQVGTEWILSGTKSTEDSIEKKYLSYLDVGFDHRFMMFDQSYAVRFTQERYENVFRSPLTIHNDIYRFFFRNSFPFKHDVISFWCVYEKEYFSGIWDGQKDLSIHALDRSYRYIGDLNLRLSLYGGEAIAWVQMYVQKHYQLSDESFYTKTPQIGAEISLPLSYPRSFFYRMVLETLSFEDKVLDQHHMILDFGLQERGENYAYEAVVGYRKKDPVVLLYGWDFGYERSILKILRARQKLFSMMWFSGFISHISHVGRRPIGKFEDSYSLGLSLDWSLDHHKSRLGRRHVFHGIFEQIMDRRFTAG